MKIILNVGHKQDTWLVAEHQPKEKRRISLSLQKKYCAGLVRSKSILFFRYVCL